MAEIGLVASIIQILSVGAKLSTSLYGFAETIGSAGLEIQIMAKEITLFSAVLNQLRDVLEDCSNQYSINLMQMVEEILDESQEGFARVSSVLKQLKVGDDAGKPAEFARRLKFMFVRSKIQLFRGYLESNKSTLQTMLQVLLIRKRFPSLSSDLESGARRIEQERELLESLVVANRLSFANLRKLEKGTAENGIREEQEGVHVSPLNLASIHNASRKDEHGMRRPRSSIMSTASRISEHRSLLEENPEGAVDCLLQRWTAGACGAAGSDAMLERKQSMAAHLSPNVSFVPRTVSTKVPLRTGEWIPDEVKSDKSEEDVRDTDTATVPSTQVHTQSEERYKIQAKQMISSRNWVIESYGTRLHLLINGTSSGDLTAFQRLKDLFEKMLVDLYWEIGFTGSAPEPLPLANRGSSHDLEIGPDEQNPMATRSSVLANTKKRQLWRSRSSKQSSPGSQHVGVVAKLPGRLSIFRLFHAMIRHYDRAAASDSGQRIGTTDTELSTVSDCTDDSPSLRPQRVALPWYEDRSVLVGFRLFNGKNA